MKWSFSSNWALSLQTLTTLPYCDTGELGLTVCNISVKKWNRLKVLLRRQWNAANATAKHCERHSEQEQTLPCVNEIFGRISSYYEAQCAPLWHTDSSWDVLWVEKIIMCIFKHNLMRFRTISKVSIILFNLVIMETILHYYFLNYYSIFYYYFY